MVESSKTTQKTAVKAEDKIQKNIDILIEGNKITKIARGIEVENILNNEDKKIKEQLRNQEEIKIIDGKGKVALPGLINTHAHVPMSIFRETLDGYNLQDWLTKKIWPMEAKLTQNDVYYASLLTFVEMVKTGCTTINDMYFMTDDIIKAVKEVGVRLQTTRCLMGDGNNENDLKKIDELSELMNKYKNSPTVTFNVGIHGLYTSDKKYIEECVKFAKKMAMPIHIHFCENAGEVKDIEKDYEKSPVEVLDENFKNQKLILAHCVKLTDEDIEKLGEMNREVYFSMDKNGNKKEVQPKENKQRINIATCPVSNLKLGCGIAKINKMLAEDLNISIGTDGQGSGSNLDLFESMKYVALLQKGIDENPEEIPAYEVLKMATINGAKALSMDDKIGSIEEGKLADIILINMNSIVTKPTNNLISEIVYNVKGSDVDTTIVNGKILMENKELIGIDENEICKKAEEIINRIRE